MKKTIIMAIALAAALSSCNLVEDIFDWSDNSQDKEFASFDWTALQKNAITVECKHNPEPFTVLMSNDQSISILPDYKTEKARLLLRSYAYVNPTAMPEDWTPERGESFVICGFMCELNIENTPFKISDNGDVEFGKKALKGSLKIGHQEGCMVYFYETIENCKISVVGKLNQQGANGGFRNLVPMSGVLEVEIITPKDEHILFGYDGFQTVLLDGSFL